MPKNPTPSALFFPVPFLPVPLPRMRGVLVAFAAFVLTAPSAFGQLCAANTQDMHVQLVEAATGSPVSCAAPNTAYKLRVSGSRHNHLYCLSGQSTYSSSATCLSANQGGVDFPIQTNLTLPANGIHGSFSPGCTGATSLSFAFAFPRCSSGQSPYTCANPPFSMQAWWAFDDNSFMVPDLVGPNDATAQNGAHFVTPGRVAAAFTFDGTNDYVKADDDVTIDIGTRDLTIDAWVKTDEGGIVVSKRSSLTGPGYLFTIFLGRPLLLLGDPTGYQYFFAPTPQVDDGQWHHVAVTVDRNSQGVYYVDGQQAATFNPTPRDGDLSNSADLWIGQVPYGSVKFEGELDEIEIFDRALSPVEIQNIYAAGALGKCKPSGSGGGGGGGGGGGVPCDLLCAQTCAPTGGFCRDGQCYCN